MPNNYISHLDTFMIFSCFAQKLKEKVGGLLEGVGGGKGYVCPSSQIIGGGGGLAPLFLRLCGEKLAVIIHDKIISQRLNNGSLRPKTFVSPVWSLRESCAEDV